MPNWNVTLPDPNDVGAEPRKETVEAPDEHSARIVAHERYGRQASEVTESNSTSKTTSKSRKSSSKSAPKKRTSTSSRKRSSTSPNKRDAVEKRPDTQPEFKPAAPGGSDK